ncbi:MAG: hypothetical protein ABJA50_07245 [Chloroflexota bacterium]
MASSGGTGHVLVAEGTNVGSGNTATGSLTPPQPVRVITVKDTATITIARKCLQVWALSRFSTGRLHIASYSYLPDGLRVDRNTDEGGMQ